MKLTPENFKNGFLIDDQCLGAVTEDPEQAGSYVAYVLAHEQGEYLGYQKYSELNLALAAINSIARDWNYESSKDCGGCGEGKTCTLGQGGTGSCHLSACHS